MTEATPTGAPVDTAAAFEDLYNKGGFSPDGAPPTDAPAQPQAQEQAPEAPAQEAAPEAPASEAEAQEEAPSYADLEEFLAKNELDGEQFHGMGVKVKVDGEVRTVPLRDVIKSFQLEGHVNNKSIELSNAKRDFEREQQTVRDTLRQQLERNEALGNLAMQQLNADYQRVDWNKLRAEDPAQYAAAFADFQQRQQNINGYLQQIGQQRQAEAQKQQGELAQQAQKEQQRAIDAVPEWRDPQVFRKEWETSLVPTAKKYGFTDAELSNVIDHRYLTILRNAARYEALQASKPAATKLVREAPKMAKPGTRTNRDPSQAARQNAFETWRRNPRDADAAAAYFEQIG